MWETWYEGVLAVSKMSYFVIVSETAYVSAIFKTKYAIMNIR